MTEREEMELLAAGIENDQARKWSPTLLIFQWMIDEMDRDAVYRKSAKRLTLRSGIPSAGIDSILLKLVRLRAIEITPGWNYRIMMDMRDLERRFYEESL